MKLKASFKTCRTSMKFRLLIWLLMPLWPLCGWAQDSSDEEELIGLCDKVYVLHDGEVCAELAGDQLNKENLIAASLGISNGGGQ